VKIVVMDEDDRVIATSSGFIIPRRELGQHAKPDDTFTNNYVYVVTNHHVIRNAVNARVELVTPRTEEAPPKEPSERANQVLYGPVIRVVFEDERSDLAVLRVWGKQESVLELSDDPLPPIGTPVYVISSPEGLHNTLSEGLISGYRERDDGDKRIQITAPISSGSSGGPLFTPDGKVIGIVVGTLSEGQNLNFAVPVSALKRVLGGSGSDRALWQGTSITEEEESEWRVAEIFGKGFRESQREGRAWVGGEQLGLLHDGLDQYRSDDPATRCGAAQTLQRASQAKPSREYEYLAYFLLGKSLSQRSYCLQCIIQRDLATNDELRAKCYDPAITLLKKSTQLNPKFSPAFARLADVYLGTGKYPEALVAAEFLVALVPNCWEAYMIRGKAFAHLARIGAADDDFATAARLRPGWFDLHSQVSYAYHHIGELRRALDASMTALSLPPPTDEKELEIRQQYRLFVWYNTGLIYEQLGDLENAARAFEEASRLSPGRLRAPDIERRIARCRAGLPGDGIGTYELVGPK